MTHEVLERLKDLQEVLSRKYVVEQELKEIPKSLNTKTEVVSRLKKTYIERNQQYEASKQKLTELGEQIRQAEHDRESSEALIVDISTQREYEALLKQIKEATEREQQFRKDLQKEERSFEEVEQAIRRDEDTIRQQEDELRIEQAKINDELSQRNTQLSELIGNEQKLTRDGLLSKDILFKFERIITKKEGIGIVPLKKGVCTGCNMILPLQFVNEVRSNKDDNPHFCPYCSMILYHDDSEEGYFDFVYDESLKFHEEDEDDFLDDEEMDEDRLHEAAMNENYTDEDIEDESDELIEGDDAEEDAVEDDDEEDEDDEEIVDELVTDDIEDADDDIDEDEEAGSEDDE